MRGSYDPSLSFRVWLYGMARHAYLRTRFVKDAGEVADVEKSAKS